MQTLAPPAAAIAAIAAAAAPNAAAAVQSAERSVQPQDGLLHVDKRCNTKPHPTLQQRVHLLNAIARAAALCSLHKWYRTHTYQLATGSERTLEVGCCSMQTWWPKAALSAAAEPKIMLTAVTRDPSTLSLGLSLPLRLLPPLSLRKLPEPDERLPGCSNDAAATAAYGHTYGSWTTQSPFATAAAMHVSAG